MLSASQLAVLLTLTCIAISFTLQQDDIPETHNHHHHHHSGRRNRPKMHQMELQLPLTIVIPSEMSPNNETVEHHYDVRINLMIVLPDKDTRSPTQSANILEDFNTFNRQRQQHRAGLDRGSLPIRESGGNILEDFNNFQRREKQQESLPIG